MVRERRGPIDGLLLAVQKVIQNLQWTPFTIQIHHFKSIRTYSIYNSLTISNFRYTEHTHHSFIVKMTYSSRISRKTIVNLFLIGFVTLLFVTNAKPTTFLQDFRVTWSDSHVKQLNGGMGIQLLLDQNSGTSIVSIHAFKFLMVIHLHQDM